jgi:hypothetical protein
LAPSREAVMCLSLPASLLWSLKQVEVDKNYDIVEEGGECDDTSMSGGGGGGDDGDISSEVHSHIEYSTSNHHHKKESGLIHKKNDDLWSMVNDDEESGGSGGKQQRQVPTSNPAEHLRLLPVEVLEAMGIFKPSSQRGGRFSLGSMRGSFNNGGGKSFMSLNSFDSGSMMHSSDGNHNNLTTDASTTMKTPSKSFFKQTTAGRKDIGVHLTSDRILRAYQVVLYRLSAFLLPLFFFFFLVLSLFFRSRQNIFAYIHNKIYIVERRGTYFWCKANLQRLGHSRFRTKQSDCQP